MDGRTAIKDHLQETHLFLGRTVIMLVMVLVLTGILIARLIYLQVYSHEHFQTESTENSVKIEPIPPTRGLIYDRNGVILAENLPAYSLEIVPERVPDLDAALAELSDIIGITPEEIEKFQKSRKYSRSYQSIPVRFRLSEEEVARFAVNRHRFPGIEVRARLIRHYPNGALTAHVLGYVGRINQQEQDSIDTLRYRGSTHIGKIGLEKTYENQLLGQVGLQQIETNAVGRELRTISRVDPTPGQNLKLHLDIELQREAINALGDYNGAVVAIDPNTGGILAMVSNPSYNPNLFVNGISHTAYNALNTSPDKPLYNRALRGQYPPGSTVKPLVGLAGLHLGTPHSHKSSYCPGYFQLPGKEHKYRDWKRQGHGKINIRSAIAQSCDVYFYELALALGIDNMHAFLSRFGLGAKTGADIIGERPGLMPSREWKRRAKRQAWYPGETLITGIGQGFMLTTPLQLAKFTAQLANRGRNITPQFVQGATVEIPSDDLQDIKEEHWQRIIGAMHDVVQGRRGTARKVGKNAPYTIAGKTGTAQVFTIKQEEKYDKTTLAKKLHDHALFIAFAPVEDPQIAIAVIAEHGGGGSSVAAPIARQVLDQFFSSKSTEIIVEAR